MRAHSTLKRILGQVAHQAAELPEEALAEFIPVLAEAHVTLTRDLRRWLRGVADGSKRFTAQQYRQALLQIKTAMKQLGEKVPLELRRALARADGPAGDLAFSHLERQVVEFSRVFGGPRMMMRALPFDRAAILAQGKRARILRYESSAFRYGEEMVRDIRRHLALGVVRGESFTELTERLVRLGGPAGTVNMGRAAERISEGLFKRHRFWAERIVRTEVLATYNEHEMNALHELEKNDPGWFKRWDATLDHRGCKICRSLDGQVRELDETFEGGYMQPPAHPLCRCGVTPWRKEWGSGQLR